MGLHLHVPIEDLSAFLDDELSDAERAAIERHLIECSSCRETVAEMEGLRGLLGQLPQFDVPRSFTISPGAIHPAQAPSPAVVRMLPVIRALSIAAAIAFLLVSVVTIFQMTGSDGDLTTDAGMFETSGAADASEDVTGDSAAGSGLIDRGDSAARNPALSQEPGGAAVDPDDQSDSGAANTDLAASSTSPGDDETGVWLNLSLVLGILALALGSMWWWLARKQQPRSYSLARA
jgi:anti-sigma factor RsiW